MKRTLILTAALMLTFAGWAFAQQPAPPAGTPGQSQTRVGPNFVDANGDGICDLYQARGGQRQGRGYGRGYGPGDGTGNRGVGPRDGTGYGPGRGSGTGICNGSGPGQGQGMGARRGRR